MNVLAPPDSGNLVWYCAGTLHLLRGRNLNSMYPIIDVESGRVRLLGSDIGITLL